MQKLTVLFDSSCGLCGMTKRWLSGAETFMPLEFVPAGSAHALERFPELDADSTLARLTVVADDGRVYRGDRAFVMCLWAVRSTRAWSLRLGAKGQGALARRFFEALSRNRDLTPAWFLAPPPG